MSNDTPPSQVPADPEEPESIFSEAPEEPAENANRFDEEAAPDDAASSREVDENGHLKMSVPTGDVDPFDHSAEEDAKRQYKEQQGTAPPDLPDPEPEEPRSPAMMHDSNEPLREEMERRFSQEFGDITVEVTQAERDAFVRSALHDEEFVLEIYLEGVDARVTVAIPPDEFTNSASAAVTQWGRDGFIDSDSDLQWLLAFQQVHTWYQIREVNGEPTSWSDYWADGMPSVRQMREDMKNPDNFKEILAMNAVRWRMLLDAVRIAEIKYKICLQNWKDRSFFGGADIG